MPPFEANSGMPTPATICSEVVGHKLQLLNDRIVGLHRLVQLRGLNARASVDVRQLEHVGPLHDCERYIGISCSVVHYNLLLDRAWRVELDTLEVIFDPWIVHVFDTIHYWPTDQGQRILVRVWMRRDET